MQDNTIYVIEDDEIKKWLSSEKLNRVNGLLFMEGNLYAGVRDKIQMIHATKKHIRTIVQNTGSIDGLEYAGNNCYIISDWQGTVSLVHPEKEKIILSNTSAKDINAADIDYIQDKKMIVVPTFFDNRVVAYELHHQ